MKFDQSYSEKSLNTSCKTHYPLHSLQNWKPFFAKQSNDLERFLSERQHETNSKYLYELLQEFSFSQQFFLTIHNFFHYLLYLPLCSEHLGTKSHFAYSCARLFIYKHPGHSFKENLIFWFSFVQGFNYVIQILLKYTAISRSPWMYGNSSREGLLFLVSKCLLNLLT